MAPSARKRQKTIKDPPSAGNEEISFRERDVRRAGIELDMACTEGYLVDLHSHLLGMGDAAFWTNLMTDYIPTQVICRPELGNEERRKKKCVEGLEGFKELECVEEALIKSLNQIKFCMELQKNAGDIDWKDQVKKDLANDNNAGKCTRRCDVGPYDGFIRLPKGETNNWKETFTDDVIYSLEALAVAFDFRIPCDCITYDVSDKINKKEKFIKDELSQLLPFRKESEQLNLDKEYLVFNARKRRFEYVKGIPNSVFAAILFKSHEAMRGLQAFHGTQLHANAPGLVETHRAAFCRALLNDAFEFCGRNGNASTPIDLLLTRGRFTPQFFPRRFILKDCMYESKLSVLTQLTNYVAGYYAKSGVYYAEISLGPNDTMNPDVWFHVVDAFSASILPTLKIRRHGATVPISDVDAAAPIPNVDATVPTANADATVPTSNVDAAVSNSNADATVPTSNVDGSEQGRSPKPARKKSHYAPSGRRFEPRRLVTNPTGFFMAFLAGLPRTSDYLPPDTSEIIIPPDPKLEELFPQYLSTAIKFNSKEGMIPHMLDILRGDCTWEGHEKNFKMTSRTEALRWYLEHYVVGFDVMGDELHHPLTPLTHEAVFEVVKKMRNLGQDRFGVRVHALESVASDNDERIKHIGLLKKTVEWLLEKEIPVRIGHGSQLFSEDVENGVTLSEADVKIRTLQEDFRTLLKKKNVVIEVNITSNHMLLPHTAGVSNNVFEMVSKMLEDGLRVIPGTDNDGIWPLTSCLEHRRHSNIAHELCTMLLHPRTGAILSCTIRDQSKSGLMKMIEYSRESRFCGNNFEDDHSIMKIEDNLRWKKLMEKHRPQHQKKKSRPKI